MTPTDHEYLEQFMAQYRQQELARLDTAKAKLKAEIIPRLKQWGVSKVQVEYSGYGDSGCIDGITYLDAHDQPVNMDMVKAASDPEIANVVYEFLPAGFEINDGSQGTLTVDVTAGTVAIDGRLQASRAPASLRGHLHAGGPLRQHYHALDRPDTSRAVRRRAACDGRPRPDSHRG